MTLTIDQLNAAPAQEAALLLHGIYEHSPWIAQAAIAQRPFRSLAHLKHVLARVVADAGSQAQLALVRAHPELAGKAAVAGTLTAESTGEQSRAGLANCTPEEFARLQQLNADYSAKFGFPFILAVRGPRGTGLPREEIIASRSCGSTTPSASSRRWATWCGTGTRSWRSTATPVSPSRAS
jgi:beta-ureidopropionase / N-carbamoyl-L-amino-acid hydrolase